jgi:hypothetical protein
MKLPMYSKSDSRNRAGSIEWPDHGRVRFSRVPEARLAYRATLSVYEPGQPDSTVVVVEITNPIVGGVEYYYCSGNFYRAVFQGNKLVYVMAKPE